ncbi:major facilitator superfamily domain-containing protein [Xylariales sp. AK1849]|nr:major facilitator superfamily domain-containing protein [Xylariales sp. AK1849]
MPVCCVDIIRTSTIPSKQATMIFGKRRSTQPAGAPDAQAVGSTQLFENGQIRYIPMPTPDPKDPLNLPEWQKWLAIASLCFFGALALSIEHTVGGMLPVFVLEYAGLDPKAITHFDFTAGQKPGEVNLNPLKSLSNLGGPPISRIALLTTLPMVINGIASLLLVPLSIAIGRRPVILFCGLMAWAGGLWASFSTSLESHLAARCFQGFGVGAVEALLPLIIQDMMFIHQRNKAIATMSSSQGLISICLGVTGPYIVSRISWRFLYQIFSSLTALAWLAVVLCVPETRTIRSQDELAGKEVYPLRPGETRPRLDYIQYSRRSKWTDFGVLNTSMQWKRAIRAVWDAAKTATFPNVIWVVLLSAVFVGAGGGAAQTASAVLLAAGWKFETLGLSSLAMVAACPFVWLFGGYLADRISKAMAKRNGGRREPEAQFLSLILPLSSSVAGVMVYGYAAANIMTLPGYVVLVGFFLILFGIVTVNTVASVYLVESYPNFAGPVLITLTSLRLIIGFGFTFKATAWIRNLGFFKVFSIYATAIAAVGLLGILIYFYGKRIRAWSAGTLEARDTFVQNDVENTDGMAVQALTKEYASSSKESNREEHRE